MLTTWVFVYYSLVLITITLILLLTLLLIVMLCKKTYLDRLKSWEAYNQQIYSKFFLGREKGIQRRCF